MLATFSVSVAVEDTNDFSVILMPYSQHLIPPSQNLECILKGIGQTEGHSNFKTPK